MSNQSNTSSAQDAGQIKRFDYMTDSGGGTLEATTLSEALEKLMLIHSFTPEVIADGGFGWVRDPQTMEELMVPGTEKNRF